MFDLYNNMPFLNWSQIVKKKICRYLLQRYLGQFLQDKLSLEQVTVDLYGGTGTVSDVTLYSQALNEICENQGWGVEVTGGRIGSITVNVPWNALMTEDSFVQVDSLYIALRPLARPKDGTSMLESMWSSMSSSMQLAKDCLEKDEDAAATAAAAATSNVMDGLERFAQIIDNILNRITARLKDTTIRLEYVMPDSDRGIAIIIKIDSLEYKNEAGGDPPDNPGTTRDTSDEKAFTISSYSTHHITLDGISFYTEEFRIVDASSTVVPSFQSMSLSSDEQFRSTISDVPRSRSSSNATDPRPATDDANVSDGESEEIGNSSSAVDAAATESAVYYSEQMLFGQMSGMHNIRIKMKQAELIQGPKVQLEMNLGSLKMFLSPRQLHVITLFVELFIFSDDCPATATEPHKQRHHNETPMGSYMHEDELIDRLTAGLGSNQGWSTDQSHDASSQYYSSVIVNQPTASTSSKSRSRRLSTAPSELASSMSSSMTSSICSSASNSTHNTSQARKRGIIDADPNADISHLNIRVSCCCVVLLHEDVLVECSPTLPECPLTEQSMTRLKVLADAYFMAVRTLGVGLNSNDMLQASTMLDRACAYNHIRLLLAPIIVEGEEQRNASGNLLRLSFSIAHLDLREVLDRCALPLLQFTKDMALGGLLARPDVTLSIKQTAHFVKGDRKRLAAPKTEINFILAPCLVEVDISLSDRLSAILSDSPFTNGDAQSCNKGHSSSAEVPKINFTIASESMDVRLRFPIADLRPRHDPNRIKWWERNVRSDFLLITLIGMRLTSTFPSSYEITSQHMHVFFCETDVSTNIELAKASMTEKAATKYTAAVSELIRITIEVPPVKTLHVNVTTAAQNRSSDDGSDGGCNSLLDPILLSNKCGDLTPFSTKQNHRESDTPHTTHTNEDKENPPLLPGDKVEMLRFSEEATKTSRIQIKVLIPIAAVQIKSKHLYETLYNRINSDLLMWEAAAAVSDATHMPASPLPDSVLLNAGMNESLYIPYSMAKSGINLDSNSESEPDSDSTYYSVYDKSNNVFKKQAPTVYSTRTSAVSFELNIGTGMITMYSPVRDSQNRVIPGQLGEFVIKVQQTTLYSVNGYKGNLDLGFLCLHSKSAELHHFGLVPLASADPPLRLINCILPEHMLSTFYPTPKNQTFGDLKKSSNREMISLAVEIKKCISLKVKKIKVAVGIQHATLRHNPALPEHTWLTQMLDMFDVTDSVIEGYTPLGVVTETHLHIWDCAIDYRPRYFPYRAIVMLGTFTMSSNVSTATSGCTLRFIIEDGTVSLAPHHIGGDPKKRPVVKNLSLPSAELVCVVEVGLFEISLRLSEKATPAFPKFDLRSTINGAHIRTCSDSAESLSQMLAYLAADGDLTGVIDDLNESDETATQDADQLLPVKPTVSVAPEVSETQQKRVNSLMEEAMKESLCIRPEPLPDDDGAAVPSDDDVEVFFFPDETQKRDSMRSSSVTFSRRRSQSGASRASTDDLSLRINQTELLRLQSVDTDAESITQEYRELLDFETAVMQNKPLPAEDSECYEPLPHVATELGCINARPKQLIVRKTSSDTDDDFCFIGEEERPRYVENLGTTDDPIHIIDNHFGPPIGQTDLLAAPKDFPMAVVRYTMCEMTVTWHLYGGHDFPVRNDAPAAKAVEAQTSTLMHHSMSETYRSGVSYSKGSPNVVIGGNRHRMPWKCRGGPRRRYDILMEVQISKLRFSHETYPLQTAQASRQVLLVKEIEVRDKLKVSEINKFLYLPHDELKKGSRHMVVIKALHLRPDPNLSAQECSLRVSLLPVRLNIDQDSLLFMVDFFNAIGNGTGTNATAPRRLSVTPSHQLPVMMVDVPEATQELQARKMVSDNLMLLMDENDSEVESTESVGTADDNLPIYFKNIVFSPSVMITLDYVGKRVQMSHGPVTGFVMGLGQLNCSEIVLKEIRYRHGVLGVDKLFKFLAQEWLNDIKNNQLSSVLRSLGPLSTLTQLLEGIFDLFWMPIMQYKKDGRIVRGLQLGCQSFTARTALAALEITTRLIYLLQITAETAYDIVAPGPSVRQLRGNRKGKRKRLNPPQDIREGVTNALTIMREGVGETAHTIAEVTALEHDQKGYTGALGAVIRQIPPTVVKPIVLATQATSNVLGGVRNQLVPDARREAREKWKFDDELA